MRCFAGIFDYLKLFFTLFAIGIYYYFLMPVFNLICDTVINTIPVTDPVMAQTLVWIKNVFVWSPVIILIILFVSILLKEQLREPDYSE